MTVSDSHGVEVPADPPKRRVGRPPTLDRAAALRAAQRVIARRGVDRTRYSDIAEESGVPVSTLQHAFGTLQTLVLTAVQQATSGELEVLRRLADDPTASAWDRLRTVASGAVAVPDDPESWLVWSELWRLAARDPEMAERAGAMYDEWWSYLEQLVAEGAASGEFTAPIVEDPPSAAIAIVALVDGVGVGLVMRADAPDPLRAEFVVLQGLRSLLGVQRDGEREAPGITGEDAQ